MSARAGDCARVGEVERALPVDPAHVTSDEQMRERGSIGGSGWVVVQPRPLAFRCSKASTVSGVPVEQDSTCGALEGSRRL